MMDEAAKKRLVRLWLRVLYLFLWSIGVVSVLTAATWLLALWRYAVLAALGIGVGIYLSGPGDSIIERITRALLALGAAAFAAYLAVSAARDPVVLAGYGPGAIAFFLYGAAVVSSAWFIRAVTSSDRVEQTADEDLPASVPAPPFEAVREGSEEGDVQEAPGAVAQGS